MYYFLKLMYFSLKRLSKFGNFSKHFLDIKRSAKKKPLGSKRVHYNHHHYWEYDHNQWRRLNKKLVQVKSVLNFMQYYCYFHMGFSNANVLNFLNCVHIF